MPVPKAGVFGVNPRREKVLGRSNGAPVTGSMLGPPARDIIVAGVAAVEGQVDVHAQLFQVVAGDGHKPSLDRDLYRTLLAERSEQVGDLSLTGRVLRDHKLTVDLVDVAHRAAAISPALRGHRLLDEVDDGVQPRRTLGFRLGFVIVGVALLFRGLRGRPGVRSAEPPARWRRPGRAWVNR